METHNWITIFLASMRLGDTPVPIPNTTVKTQEADGTALETVWESRWTPDYKRKRSRASSYIDTDSGSDETIWLIRKRICEMMTITNGLVSTQSAGKCCYDNWFYQ